MTFQHKGTAVAFRRTITSGLVFCLTAASHSIAAVEPPPAPLPNPLTLPQALAFADQAHPDLALAQAEINRARAGLLAAEAQTGVRSYVELTPERVKPSGGGGSVDDSRARFVISKRLYDFGRSRGRETAAAAELAGRELVYLDVRQQRRLEIMARFFDVLLADLRYAVDNEDMAQMFVKFDKVRERHSLGQVSDVDLLEAENRYREVLIVRTESEKRRTSTRQQLALVLNRPDDLPGDLVRPDLHAVSREIPEFQALSREALKSNPLLVALRKEVDAARAALASERARRRPTLEAEFEAAEYERAIGSRDDVRATLNLRIPLYQGGEDAAAIARAAAELEARKAKLKKAEYDLQKLALDLVQELESLKVKHEAAKQRVAFRDLALDKRRALYEMEVQTTLGDAMTRLGEAQWRAAKVDFELALAWAKVDALTGKLIQSTPEALAP